MNKTNILRAVDFMTKNADQILRLTIDPDLDKEDLEDMYAEIAALTEASEILENLVINDSLTVKR